MRFYVRLVKDSEGWIAGSESTKDVGRGPTREAALEELRAALRDRFGRVEAVAPPPSPPSRPAIDLVVMS
jgi:hypothetical protein